MRKLLEVCFVLFDTITIGMKRNYFVFVWIFETYIYTEVLVPLGSCYASIVNVECIIMSHGL